MSDRYLHGQNCTEELRQIDPPILKEINASQLAFTKPTRVFNEPNLQYNNNNISSVNKWRTVGGDLEHFLVEMGL